MLSNKDLKSEKLIISIVHENNLKKKIDGKENPKHCDKYKENTFQFK